MGVSNLMLGAVHAFDFLKANRDHCGQLPSMTVLAGDEALLKRLVLQRVCEAFECEGETSVWSRTGDEAIWAEVRDQLASRSLFGGGSNVVVIRDADAFVSTHRGYLESLAADSAVPGTLILEVASFPSNTRLAKILAERGLIVGCRPPERRYGNRSVVDQPQLNKWLVTYAKQYYGLVVTIKQIERVVELVGDQLGLIDSELSKLALFGDSAGRVTDRQIVEIVGGWRTETTWELLSAACQGNAAMAFAHLDRLILSGEPAQALFGAISWSLRRFAAAVRCVQMQEQQGRRPDLAQALVDAGVSQYPVERFQSALGELRQIGRQRASRLYTQLLAADLKMKGSHSSPHRSRLVLEELIVVLSQPMQTQNVR